MIIELKVHGYRVQVVVHGVGFPVVRGIMFS